MTEIPDHPDGTGLDGESKNFTMPSAKVAKYLERADFYRRLKEQMSHPPTRHLYEQMESSYRLLAQSQEQLERSEQPVENLDRRKTPRP